MLAALCYGGSLYLLGEEENRFNDWWVKDATVVRSELVPQPGITAAVWLKPVYRGRVFLHYDYAGMATETVADFVHHSIYQADTDRLRRRIEPGAKLRVRLMPFSYKTVHVPGTHRTATLQLVNLMGLLLAVPAGICYMLGKLAAFRRPEA